MWKMVKATNSKMKLIAFIEKCGQSHAELR